MGSSRLLHVFYVLLRVFSLPIFCLMLYKSGVYFCKFGDLGGHLALFQSYNYSFYQ